MEKTYYNECMELSIRQIVEGISVDAFIMSTNEELDSYVSENYEGFTEAKFNELLEEEALAEATNDQSTSFKASMFKKQLNEIKDLRNSMAASLKNSSLDAKKADSIKSKISQADKLIVELETSIRNNTFPTAQFAKGITLLFTASATAFGIVQFFNHAPALAAGLKAKIAAAGGASGIGDTIKSKISSAASAVSDKASEIGSSAAAKVTDGMSGSGSLQHAVDIGRSAQDNIETVGGGISKAINYVANKAGAASEWAVNKASDSMDVISDLATTKMAALAYPLASICLAGVAVGGILFLTYKGVSKLYKAIAAYKAGKSNPASLKAIASQVEDQKRKLAGAAKSMK